LGNALFSISVNLSSSSRFHSPSIFTEHRFVRTKVSATDESLTVPACKSMTWMRLPASVMDRRWPRET
jgi:hypothetical protein